MPTRPEQQIDATSASRLRLMSFHTLRERTKASLPWCLLLLLVFLYMPVFANGFLRPHTWAWSELHINYAAGFVRRGLLGEIAYQIQSLTGLSTSAFFGTLFAGMTLLEIALFFWLLRPLRARPSVWSLIFLSPALLLFPAYDRGVYMRKDLFVCIGFLAHAVLATTVQSGRLAEAQYLRLLMTLVAPYLVTTILVHEVQIFFLPVHALLVTSALHNIRWRTIAKLTIPIALVGWLVMTNSGDAQQAATICASWAGRATFECSHFSGVGALGWSVRDSVDLAVQIMKAPAALLIWSVAATLASIPAVTLHAVFRQGTLIVPRARHFFPVILGAAPLFPLGWDWGRWIHLLAVASVAVLLAQLPPVSSNVPHRSILLKSLVAAGALVYLVTWHLPHAATPKTIRGGFTPQITEALVFQARVIRYARRL